MGRRRFGLPTPRLSAENITQDTQILHDFRRFCEIDKQLAHLTVTKHVSVVRRFLQSVKKDVEDIIQEMISETF